MDEQVLTETRRALHAVAEQVLAGPQYRSRGHHPPGVTPGGFGQVKGPLRVEGANWSETGCGCRCVVPSPTWPPRSGSIRGHRRGCTPITPSSARPTRSRWTRPPPTSWPGWLARGEQALRALDPSAQPVLWPEHFDLGIQLDEVNYGISLGDAGHPRPYAYVGPWTSARGRSGTRRSGPCGRPTSCPTSTR